MTGPSDAERRLGQPTLAMLPPHRRLAVVPLPGSVPIVQDNTGVCAQVDAPRGGMERLHLPTASLACALLGPGTSITQPVMATFARHGTTWSAPEPETQRGRCRWPNGRSMSTSRPPLILAGLWMVEKIRRGGGGRRCRR